MVVTRSRLHAVRTRLALDAYLAEKGHPWKALVAFSGTVKDGGEAWTESGMNSAGQDQVIGERQTAAEFEKRGVPLPGGRQQVPDRLRPAAAAHDVRGQEARRRERRPDAVAPEPHPPRQARRDGARLRQRGRGDKEGVRALLRNPPCSRRRPTPTCSTRSRTGCSASACSRRTTSTPSARLYFDSKAKQDRLYAALESPRQRFGALSADEGQDFRGQLGRLRAPLRLPLPGADVRRPRPREALRLCPPPAAAAAGRPGRAAARSPAEHRG